MRVVFGQLLAARAVAAGITLPADIERPLFSYFELLQRWNRTINLTALPIHPVSDAAIDRLFIEPLAVAENLPNAPSRWFDLGSGGGSPAIPMSIARPAYRLTMVESKSRKAAFLSECVRAIPLEGARVVTARFEALQDDVALRGAVDLITVRAVRVDESLLRVCEFLLSAAGLLVAFGYSGQPPAGFGPAGFSGALRRCST